MSSGTLRWLVVQEQANELQRTHPNWRWGQALFNALHGMHPELADLIRGTSADPFNIDSRERVQAFAGVITGHTTALTVDSGRDAST